MSDMYIDVDTAVALVVNKVPLIDDTDFKSREVAIVYNQAGMDLVWNFTTSAGVVTQTAVTPTTAGDYDWTHVGDATYKIEIPASGGASINNDAEGSGYFSGICTGVLAWVSPIYVFRAAGLNNLLIDDAFSATRGLAGTALPAVVAEAAGGIYTRGTGAGQINQANNGQIDIDLVRIFGTALSEGGAGRLAAAFIKLFDVVTPLLVASDVMRGTDNAATEAKQDIIDAAVDAIKVVTDKFAFTVANQVDANAVAISDDTTAADNLELQYDTTGLSGDSFPANQAQVGNISTGSSAISVQAESQVLTTGTEVNDYTDTFTKNGVYHEITDAAGALEVYYQFDIGGNGVGSEVSMWGRLFSANDSIGVYAYNWSGASWDQIGDLNGSGGSTDGFLTFSLLTRHTGTGANLGKVRVRGYAASGLTSSTLYLDQAFVSFAVVAQSVGYANGAVWFDSSASNTNTEVYVDGTADNPVSTEVAVNTLIASTGLKRVEVAIDSSITFSTTHTSEHWTGEHWTAALGGQDFSGTHFTGADVSGVGTGTMMIDFTQCRIDTATIHQFHMTDCGFDGTLAMGEAGDYVINEGHSAIAGGTTPIIDTGAALANVNLSISHYDNGIEIRNLNNAGTDLFSISGIGQIIYAASCSGTVNQRGMWKVTNTGGVTIVEDDNTANISATLEDTANMQPKLGAPAADISADIAAVKVDTATILVDTNELQTDWVNGGRLDLILDAINAATGSTGVVLTASERNAIADVMLDRDMSIGADSGSATVRTVRQALRSNRNKVSISGGVMTVTKEDDTTASWTAAITTTAGNPISAIDPADS